MIADGLAVGFVHTGGVSGEGRTSAAWLAERVDPVTHLALTDLAGSDVDVAWWHCKALIEPDIVLDVDGSSGPTGVLWRRLDDDVPGRMSVILWGCGDVTVLGTGAATCRSSPLLNMVVRSEIVIASAWLEVAWMIVVSSCSNSR